MSRGQRSGRSRSLNSTLNCVEIALERDRDHRMRLEQGCRLSNGIDANIDGTVAIDEQATP